MAMQISAQGLYFLAAHEGVVPGPYRDSVGVWTYGVGHAETSGRAPNPRHMPRGMPADMDAELRKVFAIFAEDMKAFEDGVNRAVTVSMAQHEFDAAVSFHFNTGAIGRATWVKKWNAGDKAEARRQIMNWRKPSEIIPRRQAERDLWATGDYGNGRVNVWSVNDAGRVSYARPVRSMAMAEVLRLMGPASPPTSPRAPVTPQATPSQGKGLAGVLSWLLGKIFTSKGGPV